VAIYHTYTDEQLIELLISSNGDAFTEIYQRYVETLYRFAWNILKDEEECKDAIQEIFIWIWDNRKKLKIKVLKHYLLAAVKYRLIKAIEQSKRMDQILSTPFVTLAPSTEEAMELKELKAIIFQFTQSLPPRAREIFHLSRDEYLSNREIATRLNINEKTVENQMTITLRKLRHTLGNMSLWSIFL